LAHLRDLAGQHDASIAKNLTKTVRFPATITTGAPAQAKARELGILSVTSHEAQPILDEATLGAGLAAFERPEAQAAWEAELAERDRYWCHTWKRAEDLSAASNPWPG
jgi:hypothetical protein